MGDIPVFILLTLSIVMAIRRPWTGVLALAVFAYMQPHTYSTGFMQTFPAYKVLFIAVCLAYARDCYINKCLPKLPRDWRIPALLLLWVYFFITTNFSVTPWVAWPKFFEVS